MRKHLGFSIGRRRILLYAVKVCSLIGSTNMVFDKIVKMEVAVGVVHRAAETLAGCWFLRVPMF